MQEVIRAVDARPGTVTELDLEHEDWASAELKSVAADFYHSPILFCKGKALEVVLTNKEGEGFEAWRALVNKYEPTSKASVVGKLAEILRTPASSASSHICTFFLNFEALVRSRWENSNFSQHQQIPRIIPRRRYDLPSAQRVEERA